LGGGEAFRRKWGKTSMKPGAPPGKKNDRRSRSQRSPSHRGKPVKGASSANPKKKTTTKGEPLPPLKHKITESGVLRKKEKKKPLPKRGKSAVPKRRTLWKGEGTP